MQTIPLSNLALMFVAPLLVVCIMWRWSMPVKTPLLALSRMLLQLILIGYLLTTIFNSARYEIVLTVLIVMMLVSSWIALRVVPKHRGRLFLLGFISISIVGISQLWLVTQIVLDMPVWYDPRTVIPIAGMIFSTSMTALSISAERYFSEINKGLITEGARSAAFNATMIPNINTLLAVGIVSLPGMMTGQILSGVSPLVAVRYQIMVMAMLFSAAGLSTALFLWYLPKIMRGSHR